TRRYHGLLVVALKPPVGRTVLLSKLEEELEVGGESYLLSTNEYHDGAVYPIGWPLLRAVRFRGTIPTFVFNAGGAVVEKTVWMARERNTTYVRYLVRKAPGPATLRLRPLVTHRDYHHLTQGSRDWRFAVRRDATGACEVRAYPEAATLRLWTRPSAEFHEGPDWYWRFLYRRERERGLDCMEDLYTPGVFRATLKSGESLTVIASAEPPGNVDMNTARAREAEQARQEGLLRQSDRAIAGDAFAARLALAADQFLVARPQAGQEGRTVIAGYHWFGDWGRDTLVALPGLCLATGRRSEARAILRTFARYADQGLLPNRFPDSGEPPEYATVDAALWYFVALDTCLRATHDDDLLRELFPTLEAVIAEYGRGTRYGIGVDAADGLLRAGAAGMALTWMDARVGGWVVTPRWGKAVEINALWYNALASMAEWSGKLGRDIRAYLGPAATARESFNKRFWYGPGGYLYDVVDGEEGDDPSLRPNQLFAIS
ncbi:MAG: amylo-alpha-1,6-glucosidase, partial [Chloroflexota bacterium]